MEEERKYDWSNKTDPIAAKMKDYEAADEVCGSAKLNPEKVWVVRLGTFSSVLFLRPSRVEVNQPILGSWSQLLSRFLYLMCILTF